jgi:CBS domain-containing protein
MDLEHDTRVQALARPVVYVHPNDTLRQAATTMLEESVGAALVRGPHAAIGLVTERDIVKAISEGASGSRTTVYDIMNDGELVTVGPNDDVLDAAHRMLDAEVRHIPIMENGVASGMLSARDAMRALVAERDQTPA